MTHENLFLSKSDEKERQVKIKKMEQQPAPIGPLLPTLAKSAKQDVCHDFFFFFVSFLFLLLALTRVFWRFLSCIIISTVKKM